MNSVIFLYNSNTVASGSINFIPRVNETVYANGKRYVVAEVIYDLDSISRLKNGYQVIIHLKKM